MAFANIHCFNYGATREPRQGERRHPGDQRRARAGWRAGSPPASSGRGHRGALAGLQAYAKPELLGDEWTARELPDDGTTRRRGRTGETAQIDVVIDLAPASSRAAGSPAAAPERADIFELTQTTHDAALSPEGAGRTVPWPSAPRLPPAWPGSTANADWSGTSSTARSERPARRCDAACRRPRLSGRRSPPRAAADPACRSRTLRDPKSATREGHCELLRQAGVSDARHRQALGTDRLRQLSDPGRRRPASSCRRHRERRPSTNSPRRSRVAAACHPDRHCRGHAATARGPEGDAVQPARFRTICWCSPTIPRR